MSLKNFRVTFANNKEYVVEAEFNDSLELLKFMKKSAVKLIDEKEREISVAPEFPVLVEEARKGSIGTKETRWRLVK